MEDVVIDRGFWKGRRVFLTGHTGFKGAWTALLLRSAGARIFGFALPPEHDNGIFVAAGVARDLSHQIGDVRDFASLNNVMAAARPEVVLHMAAQPLVRRSWLPALALEEALSLSVDWYRQLGRGSDMRELSLSQIDRALSRSSANLQA